jgi:CxxC-x17-CxxC domain-containing protein
MFKGNGGKSGGWKKGGNKYGGGKPWDKGGDRGSERPQMHTATCAKCNKSCEVPFKPNGKKPIYCSDCFKRDGDAEPSRYGAKPAYRSTPHATGGNIEARLKSIEDKLDELIEVLTAEE